MTTDRHDTPAPARRASMTLLAVGAAVFALAWGAKAVAAPNDSVGDLLSSWALGDDTEYAPGYTERGWSAVREGMPESAVRKLLGEPLDDARVEPDAYGPGVTRLVRYTRERADGNDAGGHWTRLVAYDGADRVLHKAGHYLVD